MKYLSLDVGDRRIGAAIGDTEVRIATPIDVIERGSYEQDVRAIEKLVNKYGVDQLVVGLPRNMNNSIGHQARSVQAFANRISTAIGLPLVFWDERLTTVEATARIAAAAEAGQKSQGAPRSKKSKRTIDAIAASVILQDLLDSIDTSVEQRDETNS